MIEKNEYGRRESWIFPKRFLLRASPGPEDSLSEDESPPLDDKGHLTTEGTQ